MDVTINEDQEPICGGIGRLWQKVPDGYWREARLTRLARLSEQVIMNDVAVHVLGLPRSH